MKKPVLLLIIFFAMSISSIDVYAQDSLVKKDSTKEYFVSLKDKLGIYLYGINKFNRFSLKDHSTESSLQYNPNEQFNLGVGFSYKWMGLGIAFAIKALNNDEEELGTTKRMDFQANILSKKMRSSINLQMYEGYYLKNSNIVDPIVQNYIRPDMKTSGLGFNTLYAFNHEKYSFKAVYGFNERQKHSAGSFLLGGGFSIYTLTGDSTFVPDFVEEGYDSLRQVNQIGSINLGMTGGYAHTFVYKEKWFFSLAFILGPSLQHLSGTTPTNERLISNSGIGLKNTNMLSMGYSDDKHFFGISSNNDNFILNASSTSQLNYTNGKVVFFYGRRFDIKKRR